MNINTLKVSIILPTYNGGKYIKKAIDSVLAQTYGNWELLVIDDGSTDDTGSILESYCLKDNRIIYLKNGNNLGIQKTLNKGLKDAKGEYIARIDDDDIWIDNNKLLKQVDFLNNNLDYVLIGVANISVINDQLIEISKYKLPISDKEIRNKILGKNCFVHSSVLFRKQNALNIGGYDESEDSRHIEDYDMWLKLGTVGKFMNIDSSKIAFMARIGNITSKNRLTQSLNSLKILKKFKNNYNNFIFNYIFSSIRFLFFKLGCRFLSNGMILKIQSIYKNV